MSDKEFSLSKRDLLQSHRAKVKPHSPDAVTAARLAFAAETLAQAGRLSGARTQRLSARVDPGVIAAAREKTGITNDSDLVNAALSVLAASDDFEAWLVTQAGRLPNDYDTGL